MNMNTTPVLSEESIKKLNFNKSDEYFTHNMLLLVSKNIINGNVNTVGNIENSPSSFKKELKLHQQRILYEMLEKEKIRYRVSSGINMFVLADKVGSICPLKIWRMRSNTASRTWSRRSRSLHQT